MAKNENKPVGKSQSDKFKDLAREVDADEDDEAFDDKLRRMRYHDTKSGRYHDTNEKEDKDG